MSDQVTNPRSADGRPPTSSAQPPAPAWVTGAGGTVTSGPAGGVGSLVITTEQAAWIRTNVWTGAMRKTHRDVPGASSHCACQYGKTSWCENDRHDHCHRATPLPFPESYIVARSGAVAHFTEPYEHPTLSATGRHHDWHAMVWHADRVCRWICPCACHSAPAAPQQLDLFGAVA